MSERERTLVIARNGRTTVYRGWRAWMAGVGLSLVGALILVAVALIVIGFAITVATMLLFGVPLAVALAYLWTRMRQPRSRPKWPT